MEQKIREYMLRLHMAPSGVRIVAGVSGGADSVCLLLVLHSLSRQMGFELEAVHVEHGIRGQESIRDAEFTEALCAEIAVPCTRYEVNVPEYAKKQHLGFEEAARKLRYDAFFRRAEEIRQTTGKQAVIALAHHREDNAETVLFRLLRGSGLRGLCGIRPVLRYRDYVVIRPLLETGRGEIESYLSKRGKTYCRDSTNEDEAYSRNRLRRRILPEMCRINPKAVLHIAQSIRQFDQVYDFLEQEVEKAKRTAVKKEKDAFLLSVGELKKYHPAIQAELVCNVLFEAAGQSRDITETHIEEILALLDKQSGKRVLLPYGWTVRLEQGILRLKMQEEAEAKKTPSVEIPETLLKQCRDDGQERSVLLGTRGERLRFFVRKNQGQNENFAKKKYTKFVDYDKIKSGFVVRTRRQGDYFILDAQGRRKKLNRYMIDEKIPAGIREEQLLLADGSKIIWMIGGRISEDYKVTKETAFILEVRYEGGDSDGVSKEA